MFALYESVWNFLENPYDTTHLTLGTLLHYLGKLKIQIFCSYGRKCKEIAFLVASNFVIRPQILIFSVFKIASLFPYWLQIKFFISMFTFAINLWHRKFVTADITAVFDNNQHGIQRRGKMLIKSLYLKRYTAKRLTEEFPEKSWTKHRVNELLKKLQDTGTVDISREMGICWIYAENLNF